MNVFLIKNLCNRILQTIFSMLHVGCLRTFCVATILMLKRGSHSCMGSGSLPIRRKPLYLFDEFFEILSWFVILISK